MEYYLANGGQSRGPFRAIDLYASGLRRDTMVWRQGMTDWARADSLPELATYLAASSPSAGPPPPPPPYGAPYGTPYFQQPNSVSSNRLAAGLCGIFVGALGVHKFILGMTRAGVIMLLVTLLTCGVGGIVMHVIGIVEGIIYLTKTDAEFHQLYEVEKKEWF
jgi:TM2 domain-containing membrane protein YozV